MVYLVIYDISKNKNRSKVVRICKDYGLRRVQKSAFLGELTRNKAEMLALQAKKSLNADTDKLFAIPAGKEEFNKKIIFGELDESLIKRPDVIFVS